MLIVDIVLDEISSITGEKLTEHIKKSKLQKFIDELQWSVQDIYISKYGDEAFFSSLDVFLERDRFIGKIISSILGKLSKDSLHKVCEEYLRNFLKEYRKYTPIEGQIKSVLLFLSDSIYRTLLTCDYFEIDELAYIRQQEQSNFLLEKQDELMQEMKNIQALMTTFSHEKGKTEISNYKALIAIYDNSKISYCEKEIKCIEWINQNQDLKEGLVFIAKNCVKNNELERAEKYFKYLIETYDEEFGLYNDLGLIYAKKGQYADAIVQYENVLKRDENDINALYNLAISYYEIDDDNKSMHWITRALEKYPDDCECINFYAVLLMEREECDWGIIENLLKAALEHNKDDFYLNINLGYAYLFMKEFKKGIAIMEKLYQSYQDDVLCVAIFGMMYAMIGVEDAEKAIPLFEKAYKLTNQIGYKQNIVKLKAGNFFDSVEYNKKIYYIYSDEELIRYYKNKNQMK